MDPLAFKLKLLDTSAELTGYIGSQQLSASAVTTAKIADTAVTSEKLASGAAASNLGFTPASTGKAIAMAIVFGG